LACRTFAAFPAAEAFTGGAAFLGGDLAVSIAVEVVKHTLGAFWVASRFGFVAGDDAVAVGIQLLHFCPAFGGVAARAFALAGAFFVLSAEGEWDKGRRQEGGEECFG
jgi:hypothetical protein